MACRLKGLKLARRGFALKVSDRDTAPSLVTFSAPGSLMLLGEHAVLRGESCVVTAINRRVKVTAELLGERVVEIQSVLGNYRSQLPNFSEDSRFRFILAALKQYSESLDRAGIRFTVEAEFSSSVGFGSSAAVTACSVAAIRKFLSLSVSVEDIRVRTTEIIQQVQGLGSGADVAASTHGGVIYYRVPECNPNLAQVRVLPSRLSLVAEYCGYKTPTSEVVRAVNKLEASEPTRYKELFLSIGQTSKEGAATLSDGDLNSFGAVLNKAQGLMTALGVSTGELAKIVSGLQRDPEVYGAKISGSGLGDCAVALLKDSTLHSHSTFERFYLQTELAGLREETA